MSPRILSGSAIASRSGRNCLGQAPSGGGGGGLTRTPGNLGVTQFAGGVAPSGNWFIVNGGQSHAYVSSAASTAPSGYELQNYYQDSSLDIGYSPWFFDNSEHAVLYAHMRWRSSDNLLVGATNPIKKMIRFHNAADNRILGGIAWIFGSLQIGLDYYSLGSQYPQNQNMAFDISYASFALATHRDMELKFDGSTIGHLTYQFWVDGVLTHDYTVTQALNGGATGDWPAGVAFDGTYNARGPGVAYGVQLSAMSECEVSTARMVT